MSFFEQNLGVIIAVGINIAGTLIAIGHYRAKLIDLEAKMKEVYETGSGYARENISRLTQQAAYHEGRISRVEDSNVGLYRTMTEIHTSVKIIENWIQQQKQQQCS